jgi:hypothetical protein
LVALPVGGQSASDMHVAPGATHKPCALQFEVPPHPCVPDTKQTSENESALATTSLTAQAVDRTQPVSQRELVPMSTVDKAIGGLSQRLTSAAVEQSPDGKQKFGTSAL